VESSSAINIRIGIGFSPKGRGADAKVQIRFSELFQ
jgi:hypothetical protein